MSDVTLPKKATDGLFGSRTYAGNHVAIPDGVVCLPSNPTIIMCQIKPDKDQAQAQPIMVAPL